MKRKEVKQVLSKCQERVGYLATGYKNDVDYYVLQEVCNLMWTRCKNLSYRVSDWHEMVCEVIGITNYKYFGDEINEYAHAKHNEGRYVKVLETYYCG